MQSGWAMWLRRLGEHLNDTECIVIVEGAHRDGRPPEDVSRETGKLTVARGELTMQRRLKWSEGTNDCGR
jgi:hypothetical protein